MITGAVVLDHWGVVKADVGIRDGRIVALGKAGNPDIMDGVHPDLVIGPSTEVLAGNGRILTAGAVDCHVHLICPQLLDEALGAGVTTVIGGGTGPAEGTKATTVTPGAWHLARMLEAADPWPVNILLLGKGNTVSPAALAEQLAAGAGGFKLHEDWGSTPAAIDACLRAAEAGQVQVALHSDTLNEAGYVESTLAAIAGRGIHAYHTEGAGGGHAPDIITVASYPNVLPSSTNPTRPHTVNTLDEHLDMLMVCHHLSPRVPEDLAFAESRIRPSTMAAEDILHDLGAISMIGSDSQAMGRIGETMIRTWQTAHAMKARRGALPGDGSAGFPADNLRARRYVAKYTICPAVAHGIDGEVGSVEPGKLADLVLWEPAFFGVRPHAVLKGGMVAWAAMGDANASIPTPQPCCPGRCGARPPWWPPGPRWPSSRPPRSRASWPSGSPSGGHWCRWPTCAAAARRTCRRTTRCPHRGHPDTFTVRIDGDAVEAAPARCPWPSATSCSDAAHRVASAPGRLPVAGRRARALGGMEAATVAGLVVVEDGLEVSCAGAWPPGLASARLAAAACGQRPRWPPGARPLGRARRGGRGPHPLPGPADGPPGARAGRCSGPPGRTWTHPGRSPWRWIRPGSRPGGQRLGCPLPSGVLGACVWIPAPPLRRRAHRRLPA